MSKTTRVRPKLFVGSSAESLDLAYAIQQNLDDDAEVTVWKQGIFELTKSAVDSLIRALDRSDFAVFVFAPNDTLKLRKKKYQAVRDNVVFELGLFLGKLGRERTFIVVPKEKQDLRIPSDLAGLTLGMFNANRADKNLEAAFGPFCNQMRIQIRRRKIRLPKKHRRSVKPVRSSRGNLVVLRARYGKGERWVDVAKELNGLIIDNKLKVYAGNQLAGDPCPGIVKELVLEYIHGRQRHSRTVTEGETLSLP